MRSIAKPLTACIVLAYAGEALAVAPYLGGSLGYAAVGVKYRGADEGDAAVMPVASVRAGADLFPYFGIEGQWGRGLHQGEVELDGEGFEDIETQVTFSRFASIYGKLIWPVAQDIHLYAYGGYSDIRFKAKSTLGQNDIDGTGGAYGFGALFRVNHRYSLIVDALQTHGSASVFTVGIRFDLSQLPEITP